MKIEISKLTNIQIDQAVAKAAGALFPLGNVMLVKKQLLITVGCDIDDDEVVVFAPSTDWAQAGPIIERERISVFPSNEDGVLNWCAQRENKMYEHGPTPLVAAMRCYVASKFGYEVEIS